MNHQRDFWSQDRTAIHQKSSWFSKLPPLQKISYILLLLFVISWGFYLGMTYAFATAPVIERDIKDGSEWKKQLKDETGAEIASLSGMEVALMVGVDKRPGESKSRTDTIILAFFNGETKALKLLSIPRDTYVQFPGKPTKTKINEAYFYGGIALLESAIEYTLGIEVDHYVEIDFAGFVHLINALGGVELEVAHRMLKPTEDINLYPGKQTLNGYDALAFVRFRDLPMGDIDRIANQQLFMQALAAKIAKSTIWKAPQLVTIGRDHTTTNYEVTDALMLGSALYNIDLTNIPMYSLPGNGLYIGLTNYWVLNKKSTIEIITEITGGQVGDFHIISDEGKGTVKPPVPLEEKPGENTGAGEEDGEEGEVTPPENEDPGEGQATDPIVDPGEDNPQEPPVVEPPIVEPPVVTPIPEPIDDDGQF